MNQIKETKLQEASPKALSEVLSDEWLKLLSHEFEKDYMKDLNYFLTSQLKAKKMIYPNRENIFLALNLVKPKNIKVVILGQDPYHGEGEAHGLCFSVPQGVRLPPSLKNIFKELKADLNIDPLENGDLSRWAEQGILLLNSVLSVEKDKAASHQKQGWEKFTDRIITLINENNENIVFILWGSYAQKKGAFIDKNKHLVLESVHPSPLSSHRGFFGSKPFSKTNLWLSKKGLKEIQW